MTSTTTRLAGIVAAGVLCAGCVGSAQEAGDAGRAGPASPSVAAAEPSASAPGPSPAASARTAPEASASSSTRPDAPRERASSRGAGPRRWVRDDRRYRSPWYAGARLRMINFGCTRAPYYSPDPRCRGDNGFHHGLDVAMPCGTRLFSGLRGRVVDPQSAGSLGTAYGRNAFRIRNHRFGVDIVIGHTRKVFVRPGQRVRRGQRIALSSDMGAPDGCHLHFEVRPRRGSVSQAVNPRPRIQLRAVR
jgi:murein DD-endopeptidase MepM/ murein hydrolase activator NlpD